MSPLSMLPLLLAAAGTAYGASCSVSATTTIQNSGDATGLASCTTFSGSIAVATGTTDSITLSGIKEIDGDLVVNNNSAITSFGADSLETITGSMIMDTVQVLSSLPFPKLKEVNILKLNALANLQQFAFDAGISKVDTVDIENTQLTSLSGLNMSSVGTFIIANNRYLNDITINFGNITNLLNIEANNPEVNVSFPAMTWANNMTFRNCSSVSVPALQSLNSSLGLYGNVFESFAAPNLTRLGGALTLVSNTELTNISFPALQKVNANLQVANNTKLTAVDFPQLTTVGGAIDINGNFSEVSMPELNDVKGAFNLQSTGNVQSTCDNTFKPLKNSGKIQGKYVCSGSVSNPGGAGTTPTTTGSSSKKTGAASAMNVPKQAAMGLAGLAAAFFL